MFITTRKMRVAFAVCLSALGFTYANAAEHYPDRPVKLLVGFSPGAATDSLTRYYAQKLSEHLGTPFVVENRTGGGGNIAVQAAAQAAPDGYTLVMAANYIAVNAALKRNPYDWQKDLTPIAPIASIANLLVVPASSKTKTVQDLITAAKKDKNALTYGSAGMGTSMHMSGELFKAMTGANIEHVPYRGAAPAELDLVAGRIDFMFDSIATAIPLVTAEKLRALAITGTKRNTIFPDVPTVEEAGVKGFDVTGTYIILGPAGLPTSIVDTLSKAIAKISAEPETKAFVDKLYASVLIGTPKDAKDILDSEFAKWSNVAEKANIKLD